MKTKVKGGTGLQLGQLVEATVTTGVCERGERGVVVELYARTFAAHREGKLPGASILFERGGFDGFAPEEQRTMLKALPLFCGFARSYKFRSVVLVEEDRRAGRFVFRTNVDHEAMEAR